MYANAFTYTSAGAVSSLRLGNGKFENTMFNSRLQPIQIGLGSSATNQNLLKLNFDYGGNDNNGNVKSQTITTPTVGNVEGFTAVQNYSYDSLNRLKSAVETIPNQTGWKQTFKFDRYGNRTFDTENNNTTTLANGCPINICNPTANPQDNKLVGTNYDNVGNTSQDANGQTFVYDAENKQVQVSNATGIVGIYAYDGDGKRIKKHVPTTNETTIFVYDASGKMVAEYSTIVANQTDAKISYLTNDHLGSPRITTDATGKVVSRRDFMPFGEEIARANYGTDSIRQRFTGYERDTETDLDFAQARYYNKNLGRFTSVDPIMMKKSRMIDPQQINLYAYVRNNPFKFVDVSGTDLIPANNKSVRQLRADAKKHLSKAEFANLKFVAGKNIRIVNTGFVGSSSAYNDLVSAITSQKKLIYFSVAKGSDFIIKTGPNQGTLDWDTVVRNGAAVPIDASSLTAANKIFILVPDSGSVAQVRGENGAVPFTRDIISFHEVNHGICGPGQCAVDAENRIRIEAGVTPRTGTDHESLPSDAVQPNDNPTTTMGKDPIPVIPTIIETTIPQKKLEPLPQRPNL